MVGCDDGGTQQWLVVEMVVIVVVVGRISIERERKRGGVGLSASFSFKLNFNIKSIWEDYNALKLKAKLTELTMNELYP